MSEIIKHQKTFLSVFLRSFFLQTLWNYERMQNIGFAYGIFPILKEIYPDAEKRKAALKRHMGFFNTHPYMVNMIFGLVAAMERDAAAGKLTPEEVDKTKTNIAGPLAAIGDSFFWATWLPFAATLSISLVIFFWDRHSLRGTLVPPLFFLLIYNMVAVPFCYWSLLMSFKLQNKIIKLIVGIDFQKSMDVMRTLGKIVLVALVILYFIKFSTGLPAFVLFALVFAAGAALGCLRWSPIVIFYLTIGLSALAAFIRMY